MTDSMDGGFPGLAGEQLTVPIKEAAPVTRTSVSPEIDTNDSVVIPDYLQDVYHWGYLNPRNVNWLDREFIVKVILWWQHSKLRKSAFSEIHVGASVLQAAAVYGEFSQHLADHIGSRGSLKLIDVAPIQVNNTKAKMANYPNTEVYLADASTLSDKNYDAVLCYFLLHEIPDDYKLKVLDNLLNHLEPGGKLVIIDYHKPHWAHPVKPIISLVFDKLEPFAKTLWHKNISELASGSEKFSWKTNLYFGGLFQKVVVQLKSDED